MEIEEEIEIEEDEPINSKWIYEKLYANSKKELIEKIENIHNDKNHLTKHTCNEWYNCLEEDKDKRLMVEQLSLFKEIRKETTENCSICKKDILNKSGFIWQYEFYYWKNKEDYGKYKLCNFKIINVIICKDCFLKGGE